MRLSDLLDLDIVRNLVEAHYHATGMSLGIVDMLDGSVLVSVGVQKICTDFHRANPQSLERCRESDLSVLNHLDEGEAYPYRCYHGLWNIAIPILVRREHLATLFLGQFFYEGERPDREEFVRQADQFGYDLEAYLAELEKVPFYNRTRVDSIVAYDKALVRFMEQMATQSLEKMEVEESLRKSEDKYRTIFENSGNPLMIIEEDTTLSLVNKEYERLCGYSKEDVEGKKHWVEFVGKKDELERMLEFHRKRRVDSDAAPQQYEFQFVDKAGGRREILLSVTMIPGTNQSLGAMLDITDRKRVEEALRRERDLVARIMETSPVGIVMVNREGRFTFSNLQANQVLGLSKEELLSRTFNGLEWESADHEGHPFPEQDLPFAKVMKTGGSISDIYLSVKTPDQRRVLLLVNAAPLLDEAGEVDGMVASVQDVTRQVLSELALRESETKYRMLFENSGTPLMFIEEDMTISMVNKEFVALLGYSKSEIEGRRKWTEFIADDDILEQMKEYHRLRRVEGGRAPQNYEFRIRARDGRIVDVANSVSIFPGTKKTLAALLDITRRRKMEEALLESEQKLKAIINGSPIPQFVIDQDHRVIYWNKALEELTGVRGENIIGTTDQWKAFYSQARPCMADLLVDGNFAAIPDWYRGRYRKSSLIPDVYECTDFLSKVGGEGKWLYFMAAAIKDHKGDVIGAVETLEDITERKMAEESLKNANKQLEDIIEFLPDAIFIIDKNKKITAWNRAIEEMTGVPKSEILGKEHCDGMIPFYGKPHRCLVDLLEEDDPYLTAQFDYVRRRGNVLLTEVYTPSLYNKGAYLWCMATPLLDRDGQIIGAIESLRDISDYKNAEIILHRSEDRYRALYDNNPSMYFTVDARGTILSVNQFGMEQLGYLAEELIGQPVFMIFHPEDKAAVEQQLNACLEKPTQVIHWEFRKIRKDGSILWVKEIARAVQQSDGQLVVFIVCEDITERKEAEEERMKLEERLLQAQKMESVGLLAGGIAHDFNNLLTPILGYAEILLMDEDPASSQYPLLQQIQQASERLRDLTRQLLAFSRKQMLELKTMNLGDVAIRFGNILRRTIRENIKIEVTAVPGLGLVRADIGQIEQVLMNLAVNAQDAMPKGGLLTINVENAFLNESFAAQHPYIRPGPYILLSVSDTGIGMDKDTLDHLFEPFFTTKEKGKGTGLGLSTVYGIVKQHEGSILVYSEPGKGSTFKIYLPCVQETPEMMELKQRFSTPTMAKGGTETLLVVDDNDMVRSLACDLLRWLGYQVIAAESAEHCFQVVENYTGSIDLLLTDVVMPGLDGKEVYNRLKQRWSGLKVLYMSGYADNIIVHHGVVEEGANFIQKPLSWHVLSKKIRESLDS